MGNWSDYPQQMLTAKARLASLEKRHPGITEAVEALWSAFPGADGSQSVEGVDNTPEGIEQIRQELTEHRNQALGMGEMRYGVLMSHVIALLAELKDIKQGLVVELPKLLAQAKKDVQWAVQPEAGLKSVAQQHLIDQTVDRTTVRFSVDVTFEGSGLDVEYLIGEVDHLLRGPLEDHVGADHALGYTITPAQNTDKENN